VTRLARRRWLAGVALLGVGAPPARATPDHAASAGAPSGAMARILREGVLRAGIFLGAPPWAAHDELGRADGFDVALARQLARDLGAGLRLVPLGGGEGVAALEQERVEVVASLPVRAGLFRQVALARPHARARTVIAGRAGLRLRGFADLAGREVALPIGTGLAEDVHPNLPQDAVAHFLPDHADCLAALLAGAVDAAAIYEWSLQELLLADPQARLEPGFLVRDTPRALAVAVGERDLLRFLDSFLLLRAEDGTLDALRRRYFVSPPPAAAAAP
jgi:polar amino acid transport system substrate-binding protein